MPAHNHIPQASNTSGNLAFPATISPVASHNIWAISTQNPYQATSNASMDPTSVSNAGGSQAHNNMQPYLALNFIIALIGIFPSQN
jgi:microcystin-dependent protein